MTQFDDTEDAQVYVSSHPRPAPDTVSQIRIMTWNIRFGIGRRPWFGDACGNEVVYGSDDVLSTMGKILRKIDEIKPDILLLQEVDVSSKRSGYVDELSFLLNNSYFNYAAAGYQWS